MYILMIILLLASIVAGISLGPSAVGIKQIIPTIFGNGSFKEEFILFSIRMPRVFVLTLAGMALALSGAILQTLTKNDLADPGIIGINAGAGVAITVFYLFVDASSKYYAYQLPAVGFLGAIITAGLIFIFTTDKRNGIQPVKLVLMGVGIASALSGLMVIMISGAKNEDVQFITKWLSGNIWGADWPFILALLPWLIVAIPVLLWKQKSMNLLVLDETVAKGLGVSINRDRILLLVIAVALAGSAVSVVGSISFIGLIAPHIAKQLVGSKHQNFLLLSPIIGAAILVFADTIGRIIYTETIPAGIIVAIIGAPYFLYLLRKSI
ncbi:iron ABC transporter permease [Peribacillus psychrosaccharolyticus]|uniref:Iron ABC transporter permease n=1 Tax=Peribacillus psychrosaccharolyticus TaxID=1407 RepID=A0A974NRI8_PERPY|nr:iron ABC transporter permease [Peribacillus psychrosaccharolyticus]MEC2054160.1 iron ABC transporter permease [Peribacillus psychrosaccharolyticus]MED3742222.1 iron ABC transporter permease [Peribacillus psychrosaccharolyticus]QQT02535.1 iron ABC transporter permease [Peribacillus psychrosaccharolyticus]